MAARRGVLHLSRHARAAMRRRMREGLGARRRAGGWCDDRLSIPLMLARTNYSAYIVSPGVNNGVSLCVVAAQRGRKKPSSTQLLDSLLLLFHPSNKDSKKNGRRRAALFEYQQVAERSTICIVRDVEILARE